MRFVAAGTVNTAVSYGSYLALFAVLGYDLAYAVAFLIGIGAAYVLNSTFVFRVGMSRRTAMFYPLVYLGQYVIGAVLLHVLVAGFGASERWAAFASLALNIPISFALNRAVLRSPR